jgi:hypothetical protein
MLPLSGLTQLTEWRTQEASVGLKLAAERDPSEQSTGTAMPDAPTRCKVEFRFASDTVWHTCKNKSLAYTDCPYSIQA